MSKVFGIGLGRTGTTSLAQALEILGYSCVDYPHSVEVTDVYDAATDETVACEFALLSSRNPRSKFILTIRDIEEWLDSYEECFRRIPEGTPVHPVIARTYKKLYGQVTWDREVWRDGYENHVERVRKFSSSHPVLTINITEGAGWDKLCPFLNKPVPEEEFPWKNRSLSSQS
jgi:hypothetical protein